MDAVIIAGIGAFAAIVAATLGYVNHGKITRVQVNVDGRLDTAIAESGDVKKALLSAVSEIQELKKTLAYERSSDGTPGASS
jgi:hypothetical protein